MLSRIQSTAHYPRDMQSAAGVMDLRLAAPPAPRWARVAAHAAALTPLPSALWRLSLILGFSGGLTSRG
jgi:hypothetical protein